MSKTNQQATKEIASNNLKEEVLNLVERYQAENIPDPLTADFEEPVKYGNNFILETGENTLRILSEGLLSCRYWIKEYDSEKEETKSKDVFVPPSQSKNIDHEDWDYCYSYFVWNYKANKIQIFHCTKKTINQAIDSLIKKPKWGDPKKYDICISKVQKTSNNPLSINYSVVGIPPEPLDPEIADKWENSGFSRNALYLLFEGKDPFEYQRKLKEQELLHSLKLPA